MVFVDTCILIDHSKNIISITEEDKRDLCINSVVQLEFLVGAFNKKELREFDKILRNWQIAEVNQDILDFSVDLLKKYKLSHG